MSESVGPQLPPGFERKKRKAVAKPSIGPQLPPSVKRVKEEEEVKAPVVVPAAEAEEEDFYGPKVPISILNEEERAKVEERDRLEKLREIERRMAGKPVEKDIKNDTIEDGKLTRESWMLVPPSAARRAPAAQLKARQFSQKGTEEIVDQSIWTSTPQTKDAAELESAKKHLKILEQEQKEALKANRAKELAQSINAETRPLSLMEMHAKDKNPADDHVSFKRFDRERDIVGRQMDSSKREQVVKDARALDSKFAPSKFT